MVDGVNHLQHILFRLVEADESGSNAWRTLAFSEGLSADDAAILHGAIPLPPPANPSDVYIGLFKGSDKFHILARSYCEPGDEDKARLQCILLPPEVLQIHAGNIRTLIDLLGTGTAGADDDTLSPIEIPSTPTWTADMRLSVFDNLLSIGTGGADMPGMIQILAAALDERKLALQGYSPALDDRLELAQGLLLLLPPAARGELTFATAASASRSDAPRIIFAHPEDVVDNKRIVLDVSSLDGDLPDNAPGYAQMLASLWKGDARVFIEDLRAMEQFAPALYAGKPFIEGLNALASRQALDQRVIASDEVVDAETLKQALNGPAPPVGAIKTRYIERLLQHSLDDRDVESVKTIANLIGEDGDLQDHIIQLLSDSIQETPDAVYFFARTYLGDTLDPRWIPVLSMAAVVAMQVVIDEGDPETISHWLELIAREPDEYQLDELVRDGALAAQPFAHQNGALGDVLMQFAARRAPDLLDRMIGDDALIAALGDPLGSALRDFEPEAFSQAIALGRGISMVVLGIAVEQADANEAAASALTPSAIDRIWTLFQNNNLDHLPERFRPPYVIRDLITRGAGWMRVDSRAALLARSMTVENPELLRAFAANLAATDSLYPVLFPALQASALPEDAVLEVIDTLAKDNCIDNQQSADLYVQLAAQGDWASPGAIAYIEQAARLCQHPPIPVIALDALWRMLEIVVDNKNDLTARVVVRQILGYIEVADDEDQLVIMLRRLYEQLKDNRHARANVMNWWRGYMIDQSPTRLQQLDRALEGAKPLDEARAIVRTSIAVRRLLGRRSLDEFAELIGGAYTVLQALSDSFDPVNRSAISFDQDTVRGELGAVDDNLATDERSILAKNLKELAHLITAMADYRSKASLIRSEENIERHLLTGDHQPQSAIDTMKWLSGFLSGMQEDATKVE